MVGDLTDCVPEVSIVGVDFGLIEASVENRENNTPICAIGVPEDSPNTAASSSVGFVWVEDGTSAGVSPVIDTGKNQVSVNLPPHGESPSPSKSIAAL